MAIAGDPLIGLKRIKGVPKREGPLSVLAPNEMTALIQAAVPPHDTILKVLAWTGLRVGECFALRWQDVDVDRQAIHVRQTIYRGIVGSPKTPASTRTVDIPQTLVDDLGLYREMHPPLDGDYVFRNAHGMPLEATDWRKRWFNMAMQKAGLTGVTPHSLRHGYASLLINDPETPMKYAQEQLGHKSIQMTLDTYATIMPKTRSEAMSRLDAQIAEGNDAR